MVPVKDANSIQEATKKFLSEKPGKWSLPSVFHVELQRQTFDKATRQWSMLYDRVHLDEELDLSENVVEGQAAALEGHEGAAEPKNVDKAGIDVAVVAVYVRDDVVSQYLTGKIESWEPPELRQHYFKTGYYRLDRTLNNGLSPTVKVEIFSFSDFSIINKSIVDSYDIMGAARATGQFCTISVPGNTTFTELRKKIALLKSTEDTKLDPERLRIWQLGARKPLFAPTLNFQIIEDYNDAIMNFELSVLRLWVHILSDEDARYFAVPDVPNTKSPFDEVPTEEPEASDENRGVSQETPAGTEGADANDAPAENAEAPAPPAADQPSESADEPEVAPTSEQPETNESAPIAQNENSTSEDTPVQDAEGLAEQTVEPTFDDTVDDTVTDDAIIAAIIAQDVEDYDRSDAIDTEPPVDRLRVLNPVSNEDRTTDTIEGQDNAAEAEENNTADETRAEPDPAPVSELVPLNSHVFYFIQEFDAQKQELRTLGTFFAKKSDIIKDSVRAALGYAGDKQFLLWHRVDGISISGVPSAEVFDNLVGYTDGECFIVGEVIGKNERMKLAKDGLFSSPDRLVPYLWAVSRNHPTKSFTGTKTTEATFNGDYYSGEFKNGYFHGKGTHISETGTTYTGDFVLGERQGTGTMVYASGDTYTGDWSEDQRHGQGTFVERKTGNRYEGGYRNGKRHGKGISYWEVADEEMDLCQICYSENQDSLFYSCGHVCACLSCARQVDICPMCRKKVLNVVKIYKS
ncbi:predicted protein [Uncinocarpus reesii 1704]|uniref:RING-type domain-containing protein n=1 Tax=Uncinocarpus reesii (strain UAMH 1704) TaxID=336963 RepID=C4JMG0_UNCRE|nr:uncharacterized protein UREG_04018 [Uncinocarpus reesii 1704]EEP79172.1 predicted protein [Uncinocarpus reesii 1704]